MVGSGRVRFGRARRGMVGQGKVGQSPEKGVMVGLGEVR